MALPRTLIDLAALVLRAAIGVIFIWAGIVKGTSPAAFLADIDSYQLIPYRLAIPLAFYIPWLEIFAGACLITGKLKAAVYPTLILLMIIFTAAISSAALRGLDLNCGCFGRTDQPPNYPWLIARDLGILAALLVLAAWEWNWPQPRPDYQSPPDLQNSSPPVR